MKEKSIFPIYKSEAVYSYTAGAYATMELLCTRPDQVETVVLHSAFRDAEHLRQMCREKAIPKFSSCGWGCFLSVHERKRSKQVRNENRREKQKYRLFAPEGKSRRTLVMIERAMEKLGVTISDNTVGRVLKKYPPEQILVHPA